MQLTNREINNIEICVRARHRKFRAANVLGNTRQNIVLPNDLMSPLIH